MFSPLKIGKLSVFKTYKTEFFWECWRKNLNNYKVWSLWSYDHILKWFEQWCSFDIPVSGPILKEKATEFGKLFGLDFTCSNGWFKARYSSSFTKITLWTKLTLHYESGFNCGEDWRVTGSDLVSLTVQCNPSTFLSEL